MKIWLALLSTALAFLTPARADSAFYDVTPGLVNPVFSSSWAVFGGDILQQPFTPSLGRIEILDFGFVVYAGGRIDINIRERDENGPVIATQRLQASGKDELGRWRVLFTNPISVIPGTPYLLELVVAPAADPNRPIIGGSLADHPIAPGQNLRQNGQSTGQALDFGLGVLVPDILPTNREPIVYVEQDPPVALFPQAVITNNYFAGNAEVQITSSNFFFPGDLYVEGVTNTVIYADGLWVGNASVQPISKTLRIVFNFQATPAAVQDVLRRVRFHSSSNYLYNVPGIIWMTYSNSIGEAHATVELQTVEVNDPPRAVLKFQSTTSFWPHTNDLVLTSWSKTKALVYVDLEEAIDPDIYGSTRLVTHREDPGWETDVSTYQYLRKGHHQFTLVISDQEFTNSVTREFQVISTAQALQRWKQSVRARVPDRRDRAALLKHLNAAHVALGQNRPAVFFKRLQQFLTAADDLLSADPVFLSWVKNYNVMVASYLP